MSYDTIIYTKSDHIARITLNRPQVNNTLNQQMAQEVEDACHQLKQDEDIYAVIISGAGNKAFCHGSAPEQLDTGYSICKAVVSIDRPVIAAINGEALGQGLELALSCDIRLASDKAEFGFPQVATGLIPSDGGTQLLPRIVGRGKALELILTAETISAKEALEIGLVHKIVALKDLALEVEAMAKTITSKAPIALRYAKEAINKGLDLTMEQGLRLETDLYLLLHTTKDRTEGINAFLQKRPSQFKGR